MGASKRISSLNLTAAMAVLTLAAPGSGQTLEEIALPEPWGPHRVGVRTLFLVDSARADEVSPEPDDFRPVLVRLWYPAGPADGPVRAYMDPRTADAWRRTLPAAERFETAVVTNARANASVSDAQTAWPLLLFSPGRSFPVENYQIALEYLASMGWVVAAISPPYEEAATVLPDGRVLPFAGPRWESEAERGAVLGAVVDELVLDASLVLDRLQRLNLDATGPFAGRLDLRRGVGYLGHSLGGAVAAASLQADSRIRAAVSWEGQVYRDEARPMRVTGGSLLYIIGGANRAELAGTQFRPAAPGVVVHELVIHGAWHASYGDLLYIYERYADREWRDRHRRDVSPERVNQVTNDYVHEFFSHYLLGTPLDLLWPDSQEQLGSPRRSNYAEAELRTYAF